MKRFVCVIVALLITVSAFAQKWPMSYDQILDDMKANGVPYGLEFIPYESVDFDEDLQNFVVGVWYKYFPDYANKYGVPFVCGYVRNDPLNKKHNATCNKRSDFWKVYYSDILVFDSGENHNWATYISNHLSIKDKYTVELICHELAHVVEVLRGEDKSRDYKIHNNLTWNREVKRFMDDYGLDISD